MKHRHTPRRAALQALSGTFVAAVLAGATLSPGAAMGQDYPTRPVKMLVGFSAGRPHPLVVRAMKLARTD